MSDRELLGETLRLAVAERTCVSDLVEYLVEVDRRKLYLDEACSSLSSYCIERLGLSEDEAGKRVRVTRLASRFPEVLDELRTGAMHLSGLCLLAPFVTAENRAELLAEARGQSKRGTEALLARRFPKPDAPELLRAAGVQGTLADAIRPGSPVTDAGNAACVRTAAAGLEPRSGSTWAVQFTASAEFAEKIGRTVDLLSHGIPSGSLAELFERALDALIDKETKRRFGAGKPRNRRATARGSRYVPVDIARLVWTRDGERCAFVDEQGRRCSATKFLTIEHRHPHALGGPPTVENLCVYCSAHNAHTARKTFGAAHIDAKRQARTRESGRRARATANEMPESNGALTAVLGALRTLGFAEPDICRASAALGTVQVARNEEALLRAALELLTPQ